MLPFTNLLSESVGTEGAVKMTDAGSTLRRSYLIGLGCSWTGLFKSSSGNSLQLRLSATGCVDR